MTELLIEVCVEGVDGVLAAQAGGADRAELCAGLLEGGLTPSLGTVREAVRRAAILVHVIIRPRGGDFLYSDAEFASMLEDVELMREAGASGVVVGCLTVEGRVDEVRLRALVARARPISVTFHRAFDMTRDPLEALDALIRCGVDRVLTSGQCPTALDGAETLKRLHDAARGRIVVMGCGELRPDTIGRVRQETGLRELHFAAPMAVPSRMTFRNASVGMGGTALDREYRLDLTDPDLVARVVKAARGSGGRSTGDA